MRPGRRRCGSVRNGRWGACRRSGLVCRVRWVDVQRGWPTVTRPLRKSTCGAQTQRLQLLSQQVLIRLPARCWGEVPVLRVLAYCGCPGLSEVVPQDQGGHRNPPLREQGRDRRQGVSLRLQRQDGSNEHPDGVLLVTCSARHSGDCSRTWRTGPTTSMRMVGFDCMSACSQRATLRCLRGRPQYLIYDLD